MADSRSRQRVRLGDLAIQIALIAIVILTAGYFTWNAIDNIRERHLNIGFSFLTAIAGFDIGEKFVSFESTETYARALLVGLTNTLVVAIIGCVMATVAGTFLGVISASKNPLAVRLTRIYVEVFRNIPLLLQLFFWYAVLKAPSSVREAWNPFPHVYLSNRGLQIPWFRWNDDLPVIATMLLVAVAAAGSLSYWAQRVQVRTGRRPDFANAAAIICIFAPIVVGALLGYRIDIDVPQFHRFGFSGGISLSPELTALTFALTVYTAAFISEIVRGGIESIDIGQWEASRALGLTDPQIMRLVIIPLALRVIIPPVTSQYLNLTKNTSLAIAIGYPDLVSVSNTIINQTGQPIEVIAFIMAVFLSISLCISAFMNWYNRRMALVLR